MLNREKRGGINETVNKKNCVMDFSLSFLVLVDMS